MASSPRPSPPSDGREGEKPETLGSNCCSLGGESRLLPNRQKPWIAKTNYEKTPVRHLADPCLRIYIFCDCRRETTPRRCRQKGWLQETLQRQRPFRLERKSRLMVREGWHHHRPNH